MAPTSEVCHIRWYYMCHINVPGPSKKVSHIRWCYAMRSVELSF